MGYTLQDSSGRQIKIGLMLRIGSDPANEIVLPDAKIALFHATLGEQPDGLLIRDEKSKSGTFVNQKRIKGLASLKTGDQIRIGETIFLVEDTSQVPPVPPLDIEQVQLPIARLEQPVVQTTSQPVDQAALQTIKTAPLPESKSESQVKQPTPSPAQKKGCGCSMWPLAVIILVSLMCLVPVIGGYILYKSPKATQKQFMTSIGQGPASIQVENFSDNTVYLFVTNDLERKPDDESEPVFLWEISPFGTNRAEDQTTSGYRIDFGSQSGGNDLGSCVFNLQASEVFHFVILPDYIIVDRTAYPKIFNPDPEIAGEYVVKTSSLCRYKPQ